MIHILYFSPTGTTRLAADYITSHWEGQRIWIDLGVPDLNVSDIRIGRNGPTVLAVPTYFGRVPAFVAPRIAALRGAGCNVTLVATYGGIGIGDTLVELYDLATQAGFFVHAAASVVAEHALCPSVAAGRPNAQDLTELQLFSQLIYDLPVLPSDPLVLPGQRPYRELAQMPFKPYADFRCTQCGECADECPTGAIPEDAPQETDSSLCISCMRCTRVCPMHARHFTDLEQARIQRSIRALAASGKPQKSTVYLRRIGALQEM